MSLRPLPYREVQRRLEAAGFTLVSQKGSHVKFAQQSAAGVRTVIVPHHREVAIGTQRSILRQAGLTEEQWEQL
jgi:predicted RNA binding protein YcfA (HicA-like mRNA interferase family)